MAALLTVTNHDASMFQGLAYLHISEYTKILTRMQREP